ncbi:SKP1-like protein 1A [Humulus lupulus]|uniref:SKP1-like protein 1A n=1 Tax=Humulus lupulus TaxID=3486 RepID=UPI002B41248C|nr:SKP1-like protein 1A [Humulus lupulus]
MSSSSPSPSTKNVTLKCDDGAEFVVDGRVMLQSEVLRHIWEETECDCVVPVPNVKSNVMAMVLEFCKKHAKATIASDAVEALFICNPENLRIKEELRSWDVEFIKVDDPDILFDLVSFSTFQAAQLLNIGKLLELSCQGIANMIKARTPEQVRELFKIKNDYTPDELEKVRKNIEFILGPDEGSS